MRRLLMTLALLLPLAAAAYTPGERLAEGAYDADTCFTAEALPEAVLSRMRGLSLPDGAAVDPAGLRYLRLLHRDAEGRAVQGEMVADAAVADELLRIFRQLFDANYPIERVTLIDDYGADDRRSMAANNTSAFCYRTVAGTRKLSAHARGRAVDLNPLYNPYVKRRRNGTLYVSPAEGRAYADRRADFPYKLHDGDLAVRLFREAGWTWGGHWRTLKDYQHFEKP